MQTILVPIDFSDVSNNALQFAANLAQQVSANLLLLHVNSIPVYNNDLDVISYTINESEIASIEALKEKAHQLKQSFPLIGEINYHAETGSLKSSISEMISKKSIDFVVMGVTGHSTLLGEVLFGSNAVDVAKESPIPVFIVPSHYQYTAIKNIAYASQYKTDIKDHTGLLQVKLINTLFNSKLFVLHVIPENHLVSANEAEADLYVEEKLENVNHRTFVLAENWVSNALVEFIKAHEIDLLVIEQQKHSFLHNLFKPDTTKELAFHSPVPVLNLHS